MIALFFLHGVVAFTALPFEERFHKQQPRAVEVFTAEFKGKIGKFTESRHRLVRRLEFSTNRTKETKYREYLVTWADVRDIPTKSIERTFSPRGRLLSESTCLFREKMKSVGPRLTLDGTQTHCGTSLTRKYDASGRTLEENSFNLSGGIQAKRIYSYDGSNRLWETREYDSEGALNSITQYSYPSTGQAEGTDDESDESGSNAEYGAGTPPENDYNVIHTSIALDDKGRTIRHQVREGRSVSKTEWTYFAQGVTETVSDDVYGQRQRIVRNMAGDIVFRSPIDAKLPNSELEEEFVEYDPRGLIIARRVVGIEGGEVGRQERYSYEFDRVGNWISQRTEVLTHRFGEEHWEPVKVMYRKITY